MHDEVFGADRLRPLELTAKCIDGLRADDRIHRRQVDQVIGVNRERMQIVPFPRRAHQTNLLRIRSPRPPHPRTGREDLKRVGAQFRRAQCRGFKRTGSEGVNAEPQKDMLTGASRSKKG